MFTNSLLHSHMRLLKIMHWENYYEGTNTAFVRFMDVHREICERGALHAPRGGLLTI